MAKFKDQHIVPRRHLENFSQKGMVFVFDGKEQRRIPYKSQNQKSYFYSKEKASDVEKILAKGEVNLFNRLDNIDNLISSEIEASFLVATILSLNLRNSKYQNETNQERFNIINYALASYIMQGLLEFPEKGQSLSEIFYNLSCLWRICLLKIPDESLEFFITSDCPSIILNDKDGNNPCFLYMPISPNRALFLADKRKYVLPKSSVELTEKEIIKLNIATCINANSRIYASNKFSNNQIERYEIGLTDEKYNGQGKFSINFNNEINFTPALLTLNDDAIEELLFIKVNSIPFEIISYQEAQKLYKTDVIKIDNKKKKIKVIGNINEIQLYCATRAYEIDNRKFTFPQ